MLKQTILAAALLLGAGAMDITPSTAATIPMTPQINHDAATADEGVQLARHGGSHHQYWHRHHGHYHGDWRHGHHHHDHWRWNHRYGSRYHYRHGRYHYYYGGWWYPRPWWTMGPGIYLSF
jgi:hypothetical protein